MSPTGPLFQPDDPGTDPKPQEITLGAYNKAIGTVVGGIIGLVLMRLGVGDAAGSTYQPLIDTLVGIIAPLLGTIIAPRNVH